MLGGDLRALGGKTSRESHGGKKKKEKNTRNLQTRFSNKQMSGNSAESTLLKGCSALRGISRKEKLEKSINTGVLITRKRDHTIISA